MHRTTPAPTPHDATTHTAAALTAATHPAALRGTSEVRRLRCAAAWRRHHAATAPADPSARPAYAAPLAAPDSPPAGAITLTPLSLTAIGDGERLIAATADGRRLHFFREGPFRWSTRTAAEILVEADVAPGPAPRRIWVRNPAGHGTWWTDSAVCHYVG